MKRKLKQWWPAIPQISTKRTTTYHLKPFNTKKKITTYGVVGNPEAALGQAHKCGEVKIGLGQVFIVIKYSCHGSLQFMGHYRLIHDSSIFGKKTIVYPVELTTEVFHFFNFFFENFLFSFFFLSLSFMFSFSKCNLRGTG